MRKNISRLQFITQDVDTKTHTQLTLEACEAGANWVQLRMKNISATALKETALSIQRICNEHNVTFIINDNVELAIELNADGVHLGKEDMDIRAARKLAGDKLIIGGSTNSFDDIKRAVDAGADYVGLGPFRFTNTKANLNPVLDLSGFERVMNQYQQANLTIPIIAIGGITTNDVEALVQLGVYGVAISSAINFSGDKRETIEQFNAFLNKSLVTN